MTEIILCVVFLLVGIAIGYSMREEPKSAVPKDVEKLEQDLIVYKNLKESLLQDVKYWRDKANK